MWFDEKKNKNKNNEDTAPQSREVLERLVWWGWGGLGTNISFGPFGRDALHSPIPHIRVSKILPDNPWWSYLGILFSLNE